MAVRKRPHFTGVWLNTRELANIQTRTENGEDHSHLMRRLLAYAVEHMPKGWKP